MFMVTALVLAACARGADGSAEDKAAPPSQTIAVAYPHPLITEVLYAVPTGASGDANKDGERRVGGDEFIEVVNPHDRPIQLFGYTLTDSQEAGKGQMRFAFPALELPPGGVAVVFNGHESSWLEGVGDVDAAPAAGDPRFGDGYVFTMKVPSSRVALGNSGDWVLLSTPDGVPVHRVRWSDGESEEETSAATAEYLDETVPLVTRSSVQRDGVHAADAWRPHLDIDRKHFSPGEFRVRKAPRALEPAEKPDTP